MLRVIGGKLGVCAADAALGCLLGEVDLAEGVQHCLATTREGCVIYELHLHLLLRRVVEGCGDGAFSLQDFGAGGGVVDEADRVGLGWFHNYYSINYPND